MSNLIILDTETTGLPKEQDRICQIGFLSNEDSQWKIYEDLCRPSNPISSDAMAVHHITNEMVEEKPALQDTNSFKKLSKLNLPENIIVLQNAPFDLGVLQNEGFLWKGRVIDTLVCAKHLLATRRHALQFLRYELGLYKHEKEISSALGIDIKPHDAIGDVIVAKLLFNHLLELADNSIENLITITNTPVLLKIIPFGKYKGKEFEEAVKRDINYFQWVLNDFKNLSPDARATIEFYMAESSS